MVEIKQAIIPASNSNRPQTRNNRRFITLHTTANTSRGANAEMHARFVRNGGGQFGVSWHITVDDKEAYQHLPFNEGGFHAGDGRNGTGNRHSIGIEICENSDGDFEKALSNAIEIVRHLMNRFNIPITNVVPHKHWSGKNCPRQLLGRWSEIINRIQKADGKASSSSGTSSGGSSSNLLRVGSRGADVKKLQEDLLKLGYKLPKYGADGSFGAETEAAVRAFQKDAGIAVDGIVGNETRAALAEKLASNPQPRPAGATHTIKRGDTFFKLAKKYGTTVKALQDANPNVDPTRLQIGQVINLDPSNIGTYTIQRGDTLHSIAASMGGVTVNDLLAANPNIDPRRLQIGQVINVRRGESPTPKTKPKKESIAQKVTQAITPPSIPVPSGSPVLRRGSRGDAVRQLQRALDSIYFRVGQIDGIYGRRTEDAVRRFQSMYADLKDDGIYGTKTAAKLKAAVKRGRA